ncbi:MAG TPA: hypothetical protein VIM12_05140 [Noviherbaspirillum sp.]|uniref:hypothetical protein n=1 Tax=Noviherbaspirillum sp. TaxID=1926288 RepID=UPI002F938F1C
MKSLLLSLLLAILALQGAVPALGHDSLLAGQAHAAHVLEEAVAADDGADQRGSKEVSASTEELSDYLPFDLPASEVARRAGGDTAPMACGRSVVLPGHTPPPRA